MKPKFIFRPSPLAGLVPAIAVSLLCARMASPAAVLFSDDFNTNSSSLWTVNVAPPSTDPQQSATFAFDYSAFGIPPAPGSSDTLGLRLRSNIPGGAAAPITTRPPGVLSGLSVSPTGKAFGASYHLSFYAWVNFNGAPNGLGLQDNANSEGGTHNVLFAVGTSGTAPIVVGNTTVVSGGVMDGIGFATTGDGGITSDYRVYASTTTPLAASSGVYAAGTANDTNGVSPLGNVNLYYQGIPSLAAHSAPSIQQNLSAAEYGSDMFNTQLGQTQIGSLGFAWHRVDIIKSGDIAKWTIDYTAIATANIAGITLGGNNIALGDSDVNTTTTRHPALLFSLFDNLVVSDVVQPSLQASLVGGNLRLSWPESAGAGFVLESANRMTPPVLWNSVTNAVTANSGTLSVSLPATAAQSFYRLRFP